MQKIKTRALALLLAVLCVVGLLPAMPILAATDDSISLKAFQPSIASYTSAALGKSSLHPMQFTYSKDGVTAEGFCADHGKGMGTSLTGHTWGNPDKATNEGLLLYYAYYYSHTLNKFSDEAKAKGLDTIWSSDTKVLMNGWIQAITWRCYADKFSDPIAAGAEELRDIYKGVKGATATSIDDLMPGKTYSYRDFAQDIFNQGTAVWGQGEASLYYYGGPGSTSHPATTVQRVIIGNVTHDTPENPPEPCSLTVKKVDTTNPNKGVPGAEFYIEKVDSTLNWTVTTGSDGTYTLRDIDSGYYSIIETKAPSGYELDNTNPQYATLTPNGHADVTVTFADTPLNPPSGSIRKVDADDPAKGLAGAVIALEGVDNGFYGEYQTGAGGALEGLDWESLPYGSYRAYEKTAPEGYILSPEVKTFQIDAEHTDVQLVFKNDAKVKVRLLKRNEDGAALPGAVFNVLLDGEIIATEATNASGEILVTGVTEGLYSFVEIAAPAGYAKCDPVLIHVDAATIVGGGTVTVTAVDCKLPTLTIEKRDKKTGAAVPGTVFTLKGIHYGYVTDVTTGADGKATLTNLPVDSYEVREKSVPAPYLLGETNVQTIWLEAGTAHSLLFENLKKPGLRIVKYDAATGALLPGVTFAVYRDTVLLGEYTTNADGEIILYDLEPGTYLVQETAADSGHVIDTTPQQIELTEGMEDCILVFRNHPKPGIRIVKLDSQTRKPLANARFRVSAVGGSFAQEYLTDANGEAQLTGLEPGAYTVEEIAAPEGYLIDHAARTVHIHAGETAEFIFTDTKKPTLSLVKVGADGKTPLAGATFRIAKIEDGTHYLDRVTDTSGRIEVSDLEPGVYSVQELEAPAGYVLNPTEYHVELFAGQTAELVIKNEARPALRIVKYDAGTQKPLAGTTFEVYRDTALVGSYTTDEKGEVLLYDLLPGTYLVKEIAAPGTHVVNSTPQEIRLEAGNPFTYTLVFLNSLKPAMTITKLDSETLKPLAGVTFRVTKVGGGYTRDFTTDESGEINLTSLEEGSYTVEEIAVPEGYLIDHAIRTVSLRAGSSVSLVFTNTEKPTLRLIKLDSRTGAALPGATFRIARIEDGTRYLDRTTDADGEIYLTNLEPGVYSVLELAAPEGYLLNPLERHVELAPGQEAQIILTNDERPNLTIVKRDADTGELVEGVVFAVRAADGHSVDEVKTDTAGKATLSHLLPGVYEISEKSVPAEYILDAKPQLVTLYPNRDHTVYFENHKKPNLVVKKISSVSGEPLQGTKFSVLYASNNTSTGEINDLGTFITDENGEFALTRLRDGWYKVTELESVPGYAIKEATQETYIQSGTTKTLTFENTPLSALVVFKYDNLTGAAVRGAVFQVKKMSDTSGTGGTVIGTYRTTENGSFTVTGLAQGTYLVEELAAGSGYVIDAKPQTVYLSGKQQDVVTISFGNTPKGSVLIKKVDAKTGKPLSDVEFLVTTAQGTVVGNAGGKYVTDSAGTISIPDLAPGTSLVIKETRTKPGYLLDDVAQVVTVKAGVTVSVEFRNAPKGGLVIRKFDKDTKLPLSGAVFEVRTSDGRYVDNYGGLISSLGRYTTGADGQILLYDLAPGTYVITELTPPAGYALSGETSKTVRVNASDTQIVDFHNPANGALTIRKTDGASGEPLSGVEFLVTTAQGTVVGNASGKYVTDSAGTISIPDLAPGTSLVIKETRTKPGYVLDDVAQVVTVKAGVTVSVEFRNAPKGGLVIRKFDKDTKLPLSGAVFEVRTSDGRYVDNYGGLISSLGRYTTGADGQILLYDLAPGTYVITELTPPAGYALSGETSKTVRVNASDTQIVDFHNPANGALTIRKTDGASGEPLSGAEFQLTDGKGAAIGSGTYTTDKAGEIHVTNLTPGMTVIAKEVKAPADYELDPNPQSAEIKSGEASVLAFSNYRKGAVVIRKYDSVTRKPIEGVTFTIRYSDGRVVDNYGGKISSNGIYKTDCKGEIVLYGVVGTIVISETKVAEGYSMDGCKSQTVQVNTDDTQYITFYNTPLGGLTITKSDEDTGERLKGVKFEVRKLNGEIIGTYITDRNGVIQIPQLEKGWYEVTELKAAEGYMLDAVPQTVEVKDGKTSWLSLTNVKASGILIHKTDSVTGKGIYGVKFMVSDKRNRPVEWLTTDQNGYAYTDTELTEGWYYISEVQAAEGYLRDTQDKTVYVSYGRLTTVDWKNTPTTGQIQLTKYAAEDNAITGQRAGTTIPGAVYEVSAWRSGAVVGYIATDARGVAATDALPLGRYLVREVTAPAFWRLSTQSFDVTLEYPGQIIRLADYEKPAALSVSLTKTGIKEVLAGSDMTYKFTVKNGSNVDLESFYLRDTLPVDTTMAKSLTTGTYSARLNYRILYKTNYSGDWRVLASGLLSTNNYGFQLSTLPLQAGEAVTEIYFDFGKVPAGFQAKTQPTLTVSVSASVQNGASILNRADAGGKYGGTWETKNASWLTLVRNLTKTKALPKTGF